jgi:hypothetical protein
MFLKRMTDSLSIEMSSITKRFNETLEMVNITMTFS